MATVAWRIGIAASKLLAARIVVVGIGGLLRRWASGRAGVRYILRGAAGEERNRAVRVGKGPNRQREPAEQQCEAAAAQQAPPFETSM